MNKRVLSLVIVGVCCAALVGTLVVLLNLKPAEAPSSDPSSEAEPAIELIKKTYDADNNVVVFPVKTAEFTTSSETFKLVRNGEDGMIVEAYADLPVDSYSADSLGEYLADIKATKKVSDNSDNQADFGLDDPECKIDVVFYDDSEYHIEVGNKIPSANGRYLRLGGDGPIYIVENVMVDSFLQPSTTYIATAMISPPAVDSSNTEQSAVMYSITMGGSSREKPMSMRVYKDGDDFDMSNYSYIMTAPYLTGTASLSENAKVPMITSQTSLSALTAFLAHPSTEDLKEYGLDNPFSTAEICLAVMTAPAEADTVVTYDGYVYYTIRLGNKDEDGNYYAMSDKLDIIFLVSPSSVVWADAEWDQLAPSMLFLIDITTISEASVTVDGQTSRFELTHIDGETNNEINMVVKADGKTYSTPDFRRLYQVFMQASRYGAAEGIPAGTPEVVINLKRVAGQRERTIEFYKQDASLYVCVVEGGEMFTVRASDVNFLKQQVKNYLEGVKVTTKI